MVEQMGVEPTTYTMRMYMNMLIFNLLKNLSVIFR
jgi:hypothetical protein